MYRIVLRDGMSIDGIEMPAEELNRLSTAIRSKQVVSINISGKEHLINSEHILLIHEIDEQPDTVEIN